MIPHLIAATGICTNGTADFPRPSPHFRLFPVSIGNMYSNNDTELRKGKPRACFGEWQDPNYRPVTLLASRGTQAARSVHNPQPHHSLLIFVAPFVSCGVVVEEQWFPFCAVLSPLPGGIPLLLFQHKFLLRCLVLIAFVYCTGNMLPKPRNKQGGKLNHLKTNNAFCQLEP